MTRNEWLLQEAKKWREEGKVSEDFIHYLSDHYPVSKKLQSTTIFFIVATIFLGLSILTFIAANWDGISIPLRLVLLFTSMIACYSLALKYEDRRLVSFQFDLAGVAIFGASIFLIGQMYHIVAYNGYALLVWAFVSSYYCYKHRSKILAVFSTFLFLFSYWTEAFEFDRPWTWSLLGIVAMYWISQFLKERISTVGYYILLGMFTIALFNKLNEDLTFFGVAMVAPVFMAGSLLYAKESFGRYLGQKLTPWVIFVQLMLLIMMGPYTPFNGIVSGEMWIIVLTSLFALGAYGVKYLQSKEYILPLLYSLVYLTLMAYYHFEAMVPFVDKLSWSFHTFKWIFLILLLLIGFIRFLKRDIEGLVYFSLTVFFFYIQATWGLLNKSLFFLLGAILLFVIGYFWRKKGGENDEVA